MRQSFHSFTALSLVLGMAALAPLPVLAQAQAKGGKPGAVLPDAACPLTHERSVASGSAIAARALPHDPRLVVFPYDRNALYPVNTYFNRYTHFEFDPGEKIVASYVNDETEWEMKVSATGSDIFVRPRVRGATGSMTTISDRRRYQIDLADTSGCPGESRYQRVSWSHTDGVYEDRDAVAQLRNGGVPSASPSRDPAAGSAQEEGRAPLPGMSAPRSSGQSTADLSLNLTDVNAGYEIEGDTDLAPTAVFDDGRRTILKFGARMALRPVLFAIGADGKAEAVEYVASDSHFLVSRVFEHGLQLKLGPREARIRNKASSCGWFDKNCRRVQGDNILTH